MLWALLLQPYFNVVLDRTVHQNTCTLHCDCESVLPTVDNFHLVVNKSEIPICFDSSGLESTSTVNIILDDVQVAV